MKKELNNFAFVDGQNVYLGATKHPDAPWEIDLVRFRVYLERKYGVTRAYYYLGYVSEDLNDLYEEIQTAGFVLKFREHSPAMMSVKKGNVDTEIVFDVMRLLYRRENFGKVVLVSGDGDYYRMVQFLLEENKLEKVLFPNGARASSLYRKITRRHFDDLSKQELRQKIGKRKGGLR